MGYYSEITLAMNKNDFDSLTSYLKSMRAYIKYEYNPDIGHYGEHVGMCTTYLDLLKVCRPEFYSYDYEVNQSDNPYTETLIIMKIPSIKWYTAFTILDTEYASDTMPTLIENYLSNNIKKYRFCDIGEDINDINDTFNLDDDWDFGDACMNTTTIIRSCGINDICAKVELE